MMETQLSWIMNAPTFSKDFSTHFIHISMLRWGICELSKEICWNVAVCRELFDYNLFIIK